jgi:hypothetical protein
MILYKLRHHIVIVKSLNEDVLTLYQVTVKLKKPRKNSLGALLGKNIDTFIYVHCLSKLHVH